MVDPDLDSGFVYNEQGFVDILRSTFFDINTEIDNSTEEYLDQIIFSLSESIEEKLANVQWQITSVPRRG
ncbi:hypothetical protein MA16_Dca005680 [Dendrobium catenatum]|uniref:Uncharacterized protein n=1 Tax=Dendrobium catenatum TaxID=906689 RepID=A0A2I0WQB6_9ASPA|nr:hypothetical protein MA16_Dca005680 [Dendrobium catenatum]